MAIVELKNIILNSIDPLDTFVISTIIESDRGFVEPEVIQNKSHLDTYFGDNVKYKYMYEDLLSRGIPILASKPVTYRSKFNYGNLRISDSIASKYTNIFTYYPADEFVHPLTDTLKIISGEDTVSSVLRFSGTQLSDSNYIILPSEGLDVLIWMFDGTPNITISSTFYDTIHVIDLDSFSSNHERMVEFINVLTTDLNYIVIEEHIRDLILYTLDRVSVDPSVETGAELSTSYLSQIDDYLISSNESDDAIIRANLDTLIQSIVIDVGDDADSLRGKILNKLEDEYLTLIDSIEDIFLVCQYPTQEYHRRFYSFESFGMEIDIITNNLVMTESTESTKLIDFFTKSSGDDEINIKIEPLTHPLYNIEISKGSVFETHVVSTLKSYKYQEEYVFIEDVINFNSDLIRCVSYEDGIVLEAYEGLMKGVASESYQYDDISRTIGLFVEEEVRSDIFLLNYYDQRIISHLNDLVTNDDFIAFITVPKEAQLESYFNYVSAEDRLLYFNDLVYYNEDLLPVSYLYLLNFLSNQYIKTISEDIRLPTLSEEDQEFLERKSINYLEYNNLDYFYVSLLQDKTTKSIILRYIMSKINRVYRNSQSVFVRSIPTLTVTRIEELNEFLKILFPVISEINYSFITTGNNLNITLDVILNKVIETKKLNLFLDFKIS